MVRAAGSAGWSRGKAADPLHLSGTVARTYQELEQDGMLTSRRGEGARSIPLRDDHPGRTLADPGAVVHWTVRVILAQLFDLPVAGMSRPNRH